MFATHDEPLNAIARGADRLGERFLFPVPALGGARPGSRASARSSRRPRRAGVAVPRLGSAGLGGGGAGRPRTTSATRSWSSRPRPRASSAASAGRRSGARTARRSSARTRTPRSTSRSSRSSFPAATGRSSRSAAISRPTARRSASSAGASCARRRPGSAPAAWARRSGRTTSSTRGCGCFARLGHTGLSQVEFKRDPRDGVLRLMEINPRLWQWHGLAAACGVDLPRIAYRGPRRRAAGTGLDERDARAAGRSRCRPASARPSSGRRTSTRSSPTTTSSPRSSSSRG